MRQETNYLPYYKALHRTRFARAVNAALGAKSVSREYLDEF